MSEVLCLYLKKDGNWHTRITENQEQEMAARADGYKAASDLWPEVKAKPKK
jgi:hypothetical protein